MSSFVAHAVPIPNIDTETVCHGNVVFIRNKFGCLVKNQLFPHFTDTL
jgi:hypothetical protein